MIRLIDTVKGIIETFTDRPVVQIGCVEALRLYEESTVKVFNPEAGYFGRSFKAVVTDQERMGMIMLRLVENNSKCIFISDEMLRAGWECYVEKGK